MFLDSLGRRETPECLVVAAFLEIRETSEHLDSPANPAFLQPPSW